MRARGSRRVPSWSSATSIWTRSSSSRRSARSARTTRSASMACVLQIDEAAGTPHLRRAGGTGAPPPRRRLHRSPRDPAPRRLRRRGPRSPGQGERRRRTRMPQDRRKRTRVDSQVVPAISSYRPSRRRAAARVPASGRLRLPPAGTPSSRCSIEGLAKADRSLVKTERTFHLSTTERACNRSRCASAAQRLRLIASSGSGVVSMS